MKDQRKSISISSPEKVDRLAELMDERLSKLQSVAYNQGYASALLDTIRVMQGFRKTSGNTVTIEAVIDHLLLECERVSGGKRFGVGA